MSFSSSALAHKYKLSICTVFKDNASFLKEWIEFHRLVGVDHFYLYNNSSSDNYLEVLDPYIKSQIVTLTDWPDRDQDKWGNRLFAWVYYVQIVAFEHAIKSAVGVSEWIAPIDSDEFLVPVVKNTIPEILDMYKFFPAVSIHWKIHGTAGIYEIPPKKLMIELLNRNCAPGHPLDAKCVKPILKPEEFVSFSADWAPHTCNYRYNLTAVSPPISVIRINHYMNGTVKHYVINKIKNRNKQDNYQFSEEEFIARLALGNDIDDKERVIHRFIPEMRKRMGLDP
jgi:hypothetical protein